MYHNVFRYEYLTFQTQIHLHKQYIFDANIIQSEYAFLYPFSIYVHLINLSKRDRSTMHSWWGYISQHTLRLLLSEIQISGPTFVIIGETIELTCNATDLSYPIDIDWFKNGVKRDNAQTNIGQRDSATDVFTSSSVLTITDAKLEDAGRYVCRTSGLQVTSKMVRVIRGEVLLNACT